MRRFAWVFVVGLALLIVPTASFGQEDGGKKGDEVPAKEGDKVEADARGKKSNKVKVRDPRVLDLSSLPAAKSSLPCSTRTKDYLSKLSELDPSFGKEVEKKLKATPSLRDRWVYLLNQIISREQTIDYAELGYRNGVTKKKEVEKNINLRGFMATLAKDCAFVYLLLLQNKFDKVTFKKHQSFIGKAVGAYKKAHKKNRADRRKKLGIPLEQGTTKRPKK